MLGYLAGRLLLRRELASRTVAIEVGMQNSGLGVVLAQQNFANPLVALPCALSPLFRAMRQRICCGARLGTLLQTLFAFRHPRHPPRLSRCRIVVGD